MQQNLQGIVDILTRLYREIHEIETAHGLLFGNGDFRPRVDYFHDAIRAFIIQPQQLARLTVELLTYDLSCLRFLQSNPLAAIHRHGTMGSANPPGSLAPAGYGKPDREAKMRLGELYQQYAVLFAAMLKPTAERDYIDRSEEANETITQMVTVLNTMQDFEKGAISAETAAAMIQHVEDPALKALLQQAIQRRKREQMQQAMDNLKLTMEKIDKDVKTLENAYANYSMTQLSIYEEGKDVVKKLASHGMNLAGKFVETAMAQSRRDMGMGR